MAMLALPVAGNNKLRPETFHTEDYFNKYAK